MGIELRNIFCIMYLFIIYIKHGYGVAYRMNDGKLERYVLHPKHAAPTHATPAAPTHATHATPEKNHQFTNQSSSPLPTSPPTSTHNSTPSYNHSSAHNPTYTSTHNSIHTTTHNSTHTSTRNSTHTSIHNYTIDSTTKPSRPEIGIKTVPQLATLTNKLKAKSERRRPNVSRVVSRQPEKLATVGVSTVGGVAIGNGVRAYSQLTAENQRDIEEFERSLLANFESSEIHKSADSNIVALQRLRISQASARTTVGIRNGRPSGRGQTTARPLRISETTNAYRSSSLRATMPSRLNVVKAVPRRLSDDDDEMSALFSKRAVREKYLVKTIGGILAGFTVIAILIGAVVINWAERYTIPNDDYKYKKNARDAFNKTTPVKEYKDDI